MPISEETYHAGEEEREELKSIDTTDTLCGYTTSCKPKFLQKCANPKIYLLIISLCSIIQGFAVNGINNVNISSYERRYLLSSKNSGLVASFYDVAAGVSVLFVGYFGGTGHQPRYLGAGVASIGLGCFIMSLAHFTAPPYQPVGTASLTCDVTNSNHTARCDVSEDNAFLKNYLYILLLGQALNGFGGTCLYSLGVTYLDQSVSAKISPLYVGIMAGSSILGPALGYILGGSLLNIYVDFPKPPPDGLTPSDPRWVGAWWLGFVISSIISTLLAFFMFLFPRELPGTAAIRAAKISEAHRNSSEKEVNRKGFGMTFRDMPKAAWYLLRNPTLMCIAAVGTVEIALSAGFSTFMPKYISNQFGHSSSWSAMLTGFMAVPGAALGQFMGGYICKRFQLKVPGILKLMTTCSILVILSSPVLWIRCGGANLAGVFHRYPSSPSGTDLSLDSTCNSGCGCTTSVYDPVCADGIQYFSPCHAGCSQKDIVSNELYRNCTCPAGMNQSQAKVKRGACPANCKLLGAFIPICFLLFFFTFMMGAPLTMATLRVVPESQRAFAVSLKWVFLRFFGSIPGPIMFGSMIDASCSLWDDECSVRGSCWVYNNFNMSMRLFVITIVLKIISLTCNVLGIVLYKPPAITKDADTQVLSMQALAAATSDFDDLSTSETSIFNKKRVYN